MKPIAILLASVVLIACGTSAETVDENQVISKKNSEHNFRQFLRREMSDVVDWSIQSDSTISSECPYGDGWATGKAKTAQGEQIVKCQTNGSGKGIEGCLILTDFNKKDYADQEGNCDKSIKKLSLLEKD